MPLLLAIGQLDDPACFGVLARSVGLALLAYLLLLAASIGGIHALLAAVHWPGWLAALLGTLGVVVLAVWLFLPTIMLIATLFIERIARAVDRRHYPWLPPPSPAALPLQLWDGLALALQVLVLNAVALMLALLPIPGVGFALALLVSGWAIGRGLFVAVAMRRMGRLAAVALYRRRRLAVLLPGLLLAAAASLPGLNLLVPIVGAATMVHVLNRSLA
jgi:uncharacterized protein involved in cysteine biosynthesis